MTALHVASILVSVPGATYPVEIGAGLLSGTGERLDTILGGRLQTGQVKPFLVSSPEIARLWAEPLLGGFPRRPEILLVEPGEAQKRLPTLERLAEELATRGADRSAILLALGGGVLGDLTGFLAAVYMRGIPFVQLPTTALAQIDSSVGGKTGVNLLAGKNLVGAFHHPLAVFADTDTLRTLPPAELRAGLQEAVKAAILGDRALFDRLEQDRERILAGDPESLGTVIAASVRLKAEIVALDEREAGPRMLLNLGHTLGHALEAATGYRQLLHGEAVAWGMLAALEIAARRAMVPTHEAARIRALITGYGPLRRFEAEAATLVALTARDKKNRAGRRSFVLPTGIGHATIVHDVSDAELLAAAAVLVQQARTLGQP